MFPTNKFTERKKQIDNVSGVYAVCVDIVCYRINSLLWWKCPRQFQYVLIRNGVTRIMRLLLLLLLDDKTPIESCNRIKSCNRQFTYRRNGSNQWNSDKNTIRTIWSCCDCHSWVYHFFLAYFIDRRCTFVVTFVVILMRLIYMQLKTTTTSTKTTRNKEQQQQ